MTPQAPSQVLKTNFRWELVGGPKLKIALLVVNCLALIESHLRSPLLFSHLSCQLNFLPVLWKQNFNFGLSRDLRWRECTKVFLTYFIGLTCKCNRWRQQQRRSGGIGRCQGKLFPVTFVIKIRQRIYDRSVVLCTFMKVL